MSIVRKAIRHTIPMANENAIKNIFMRYEKTDFRADFLKTVIKISMIPASEKQINATEVRETTFAMRIKLESIKLWKFPTKKNDTVKKR